jgi:hypothetical protein
LSWQAARKSEQILPLIKEAFTAFPLSLRFATIYSGYLIETTQDKEGAIAILRNVLKENYSVDVLSYIAVECK